MFELSEKDVSEANEKLQSNKMRYRGVLIANGAREVEINKPTRTPNHALTQAWA